jgi:hypothetical protein
MIGHVISANEQAFRDAKRKRHLTKLRRHKKTVVALFVDGATTFELAKIYNVTLVDVDAIIRAAIVGQS